MYIAVCFKLEGKGVFKLNIWQVYGLFFSYFPFRCLPSIIMSWFLFKSKNKKRFMNFNPFLSSFSAFLYEMAAMPEQYFDWNEPKAHFKIDLYILYRWSCHLKVVLAADGEWIYCCTSEASPTYLHRIDSVLVSFCPSLMYTWTQVHVNETEWMNDIN